MHGKQLKAWINCLVHHSNIGVYILDILCFDFFFRQDYILNYLIRIVNKTTRYYDSCKDDVDGYSPCR
jgi:hypothetical protein